MGPFFWAFIYVLVVGIGAFVWGARTTPISPPVRTSDRTAGAEGYLFHQLNRLGLRSGWAVVFDELLLGVAFFFLFRAFVGT